MSSHARSKQPGPQHKPLVKAGAKEIPAELPSEVRMAMTTNDLPSHLVERKIRVKANMDILVTAVIAAVDSEQYELPEKIDLIERLRSAIMSVRTVRAQYSPAQAVAGFGPRRRTA